MTSYPMNLINSLVLIVYVLSSSLLIIESGEARYQSVLCPQSRRQNADDPCNTSTNCRFGGECRKVADVSGRRSTTRYIVPNGDEDFDQHGTDAGPENDPKSVVDFSQSSDSADGNKKCICNFNCGTRENREVCGTNGHTYLSRCHLRRDACRCQTPIEVAHVGECFKDTLVEDHPTPKFRLKKRPLRNCERDCLYGGKCDELGYCLCEIKCPRNIDHVCGDNGITYINQCHLRLAQCEKQIGIAIHGKGACSRNRRDSESCLRNFCDRTAGEQVCGSDGVSYSNECTLRHAACKKKKPIEVSYRGLCGKNGEVKKSKVETGEGDPCIGIECDYDGVCLPDKERGFRCSCEAICDEENSQSENRITSRTHEDIMKPRKGALWRPGARKGGQTGRMRSSRRNPRRRKERARRSIDGLDEPKNNTSLCASDGKTYKSHCQFKKHSCHEGIQLTIIHNGPCVKRLPSSRQPKRSQTVDTVAIDYWKISGTKQTAEPDSRNYPRYNKELSRTSESREGIDVTTAKTEIFRKIDQAQKTPLEYKDPIITNNINSTQSTNSNSASSTSPLALRYDEESTKSSVNRTGESKTEYATEASSYPTKTTSLTQETRKRGAFTNLTSRSAHRANRNNEIMKYIREKLENATEEVCKKFKPTLEWYHVALISFATQAIVAIVLVSICIYLKGTKREKALDQPRTPVKI